MSSEKICVDSKEISVSNIISFSMVEYLRNSVDNYEFESGMKYFHDLESKYGRYERAFVRKVLPSFSKSTLIIPNQINPKCHREGFRLFDRFFEMSHNLCGGRDFFWRSHANVWDWFISRLFNCSVVCGTGTMSVGHFFVGGDGIGSLKYMLLSRLFFAYKFQIAKKVDCRGKHIIAGLLGTKLYDMLHCYNYIENKKEFIIEFKKVVHIIFWNCLWDWKLLTDFFTMVMIILKTDYVDINPIPIDFIEKTHYMVFGTIYNYPDSFHFYIPNLVLNFSSYIQLFGVSHWDNFHIDGMDEQIRVKRIYPRVDELVYPVTYSCCYEIASLLFSISGGDCFIPLISSSIIEFLHLNCLYEIDYINYSKFYVLCEDSEYKIRMNDSYLTLYRFSSISNNLVSSDGTFVDLDSSYSNIYHLFENRKHYKLYEYVHYTRTLYGNAVCVGYNRRFSKVDNFDVFGNEFEFE